MTRSMCISLILFGCVAIGGLGEAAAAPGYLDGNFASVTTQCPVTNNLVTAASSYVGYYADLNAPFPQTGDAGYLHAVAANVSGCVNDAQGIELFLPLGASQNTANPVICIRGKLDGSFVEYVPTGTQSSCLQSPAAGSNGGAFYGWSVLPPGWYLEIRVPVDYQRQLFGLGGPATHNLSAKVTSTYGTMSPVQPVTVFYRALLTGQGATTFNPNSATLSFTLFNFFVGGQLYVDFGTTPSLGTSTPPSTAGNTFASAPVSVPLSGLSPGTTYHWRARYVTANGTFVSSTQSFSTLSLNPTPLPPGPRPCPRGGC